MGKPLHQENKGEKRQPYSPPNMVEYGTLLALTRGAG